MACLVNHNRDPFPLFFVSVASKGLSPAVSLLFATLAGRSISVAAKGLMGMGNVCTSERRGYPLPAPFLKRYESKGVRGWGSAKRLREKDLGDRE